MPSPESNTQNSKDSEKQLLHGEGTQHEEVKYHADVVGVTLTKFIPLILRLLLLKRFGAPLLEKSRGDNCFQVQTTNAMSMSRVELIFAIGLYVSAMASLLFLFEMIKPSIVGLF